MKFLISSGFLSRRIVSVAGALCLFTALAWAEPTYIIDTPTTNMLGYGCYDLNFRLFSSGGVLTRLNFGVFKVVNLGFGWEVNNAMGKDDMVVGPPALFLKIKPFAGGMVLPAFAFGYDGQGYFYEKDRNEFREKEKGIFLVLSKELVIPGLELNFGGNINDFKRNTLYGFVNMNFNLEDKFILLAEYDRINYLPDSRLNIGFRFFINDDLSIDLAGRDIGAGSKNIDPALDRTTERIVRVSYTGKF